ncbi:hypothetical protein [Pseudovibrio sp. Tun.PSC04-5.I4]|uniref:hypothetical protein n=1 Tax=Pseudovibrio sp. Tun.PSC04-5.I4 TaxID=1798213 RepID=UPI0008801DEF|nr:hypothetical protein [Pseudovibrio sp. Tun.PSC04-5.I4]SDQ17532.1 hypothetical protein SAMN04515695_0327 [Pseudovibrio sp. Tun.PSC04-5.I4]
MGEISDRVEERYHDRLHHSNESARISTAVDAFSHKMKARMRANIDKKHCWDDLHQLTGGELKKKLLAAVIDEDWVSVGNYAMIASGRR